MRGRRAKKLPGARARRAAHLLARPVALHAAHRSRPLQAEQGSGGMRLGHPLAARGPPLPEQITRRTVKAAAPAPLGRPPALAGGARHERAALERAAALAASAARGAQREARAPARAALARPLRRGGGGQGRGREGSVAGRGRDRGARGTAGAASPLLPLPPRSAGSPASRRPPRRGAGPPPPRPAARARGRAAGARPWRHRRRRRWRHPPGARRVRRSARGGRGAAAWARLQPRGYRAGRLLAALRACSRASSLVCCAWVAGWRGLVILNWTSPV
jgi:hypothetical protein